MLVLMKTDRREKRKHILRNEIYKIWHVIKCDRTGEG